MISDRQIMEQACENIRTRTDRDLLLAIGKKVLEGFEYEYFKTEYENIDKYERKRSKDL